MEKVTLSLSKPEIHYDILIDKDLLTSIEMINLCHDNVAIISDSNIESVYGNLLKNHLEKNHLNPFLYSFPSGEASKNRSTKEKLEDQMFSDGLGRDTTLIALGGGVATDLGGYIAATYCRGIPLIMCPTSLLAMVDASIGGKTGVNVSYGKNLIGAIYQPKSVLIDISTLKTLPEKEWKNGMVEMIKHAVIADSKSFDQLEKLTSSDSSEVINAIANSCRIKRNVVQLDETENHLRRILNFGHTFGHAIEKLSNYKVNHGEAVAVGAIIESTLSHRLGYLSEEDCKRIVAVFQPYCPSNPPKASPDKIIETMKLDKKAKKGVPRFVIVDKIGSVASCDDKFCLEVDEKILSEVIHDMYRY